MFMGFRSNGRIAPIYVAFIYYYTQRGYHLDEFHVEKKCQNDLSGRILQTRNTTYTASRCVLCFVLLLLCTNRRRLYTKTVQ